MQSNHAVFHLALKYHGIEGIPNIVLIGIPNIRSLSKVERKLQENSISHFSWHEPDFDLGFTSIATVPLSGDIRKVLENYRLYPRACRISECTSASKAEGAGISPAERATGDSGRHLTPVESESPANF